MSPRAIIGIVISSSPGCFRFSQVCIWVIVYISCSICCVGEYFLNASSCCRSKIGAILSCCVTPVPSWWNTYPRRVLELAKNHNVHLTVCNGDIQRQSRFMVYSEMSRKQISLCTVRQFISIGTVVVVVWKRLRGHVRLAFVEFDLMRLFVSFRTVCIFPHWHVHSHIPAACTTSRQARPTERSPRHASIFPNLLFDHSTGKRVLICFAYNYPPFTSACSVWWVRSGRTFPIPLLFLTLHIGHWLWNSRVI